MSELNDHVVAGVCRVCRRPFVYYKAEGKRWTCSHECEEKRKAIARSAANRWKPKKGDRE